MMTIELARQLLVDPKKAERTKTLLFLLFKTVIFVNIRGWQKTQTVQDSCKICVILQDFCHLVESCKVQIFLPGSFS